MNHDTQSPVHRMFEACARLQPEALAVAFNDSRLTYAELDERANRLARRLIECGATRGAAVAVCVRPSPELLIAMLAIFKAGALYLPLDPTHPPALLARMMDEARPCAVVTHSSFCELIPFERFTSITWRYVARLSDEPSWAWIDMEQITGSFPSTAPLVEHDLAAPACLFYTSGTTGQPKGVLVTYANLVHYVTAAQHKYRFVSSDVFCAVARPTFSISLFELLTPLCCGAAVRVLERDDILAPDRLCAALQEVTVVHAGPSLLGSLFRHMRTSPLAPRPFPTIRHASTGGDMVPPSIAEEMKRVFANAEIYVIYGCTEISCMGTTFAVHREGKMTRTLVGEPFADVELRVLDAQERLVPPGVVGEICFAGKGVAGGYLDRPGLTTAAFVEIDRTRFYKTGDMGRICANGNLEILGRRDFQVKIRGIRIELAGLESTVLELGLATQCAVTAHAMGDNDVRLVAFVVEPTITSMATFRATLSAQLPDYMVPHHVVVLEAMPLTPNGKLDRNALKDMPWTKQLGASARRPPENVVERKLAEVFQRVLGVDEVGVDDNFFDLGGDSLSAVMAMDEIEHILRVPISPRAIFDCGSVRRLAAQIVQPTAESPPILLSRSSNQPPLFMLSGVQIYRGLAERLRGCSAYGVFLDREARACDADPARSVRDLAREYVPLIRRAQSKGPYRLLGYSFAGILAYEVAQQLQSAGEQVTFLGLVDAELPEWGNRLRFRVAQLARLPSASASDIVALVRRKLQRTTGCHGDVALRSLEKQRDLVNGVAAMDYVGRIVPFTGNVTLITADRRLRQNPLHSRTCGWGPYVPSIDVHAIDADHFQLMSDEPYLSQIAQVLDRRIINATR